MGKSKKQQRQKAFQIFEGNAAAQEALKQAFQKKGKSGDKITNKEIGNIARAGATQEQLNQLVDRVARSSGRLRIGTVDVGSYFPGSQVATADDDDDDESPFEFPEFPDYSGQIKDALASADDKYQGLIDQMKIDQEAALERQRLAEEARQKQMLIGARRERAAGRSPSLQIRAAGELSKTAGTQGFRRRRDQFKRRAFQPLAPIAAQGAANQLVNI